MDSTQDTKPQHRGGRDVAGFLSLGVDEDRDKLLEATPAGISPTRAGGEEEKGTQAAAEQGAASAEGRERGAEEEAKDGSVGGPGAPGPRDDENHQARGDSGRGAGAQGREAQPLWAVVQCPQPGDRQQVVQHAGLTEEQVQELERVFDSDAYPSLQMIRELARQMTVPEATVQAWFKCRRAKWRRQQRPLMLRNTGPLAPGLRVATTSCRPFNAVLIPQPVWMSVTVPLLLWPPLQPMPPFPPLFLPPPPLVLVPLSPWGRPPRGWAWFLTPNGPVLAPIF